MTLPDAINGLFECLGGVLLLKNCHRLYLDKEVKGVSVPVTAFFWLWGIWNCYFYPSLDQWLSFTGGLVIVTANFLWVAMAIYYSNKKHHD